MKLVLSVCLVLSLYSCKSASGVKGSDLASDNSEGVENEAFPIGKVLWACSNDGGVTIFLFTSKKDRKGDPATIQDASVIKNFEAAGGDDGLPGVIVSNPRTKLDCMPMPDHQFGVDCLDSLPSVKYSLRDTTNDDPTREVLRIPPVGEPFSAVINRGEEKKDLNCKGIKS